VSAVYAAIILGLFMSLASIEVASAIRDAAGIIATAINDQKGGAP